MKQIYTDLWQSEQGSQFGLSLKTYLLKTPQQNVLIYFTNIARETEDIKQLGGAQFQFISHHHEFLDGFYQNLIDFEPKLILHEQGVRRLRENYENRIEINSDLPNNGLTILSTPGHTDSSLCLYYQSAHGKNYLFTGDTIYLHHNEWNIFVMPSDGGSNDDMKQTLMKLRNLEVDVICPSVSVGTNRHVEVNREEWLAIIDTQLAKLK